MIGQTISHYKILEKLGEGGMGVVYKAEDTKLGRCVAMKFLPPHVGTDEEKKSRFIQEARAASVIDHPNIGAIYEINETTDGSMYIVMACYDVDSLKDKIEKGPLEINQAIDFSLQIAQGMAKAHERGIIHRDLKPGNVLITNDNIAKIIDFGLAKLSGGIHLTKSGTTLGTVAYMSPEQARGKNVDARSDIWSLGIMLFEMLTGKLPFRGEFEAALMYSITNENPLPVETFRTALPFDLKLIIARALQKDPKDRYQRMDEIVTDLKALHLKTQTSKVVSDVSESDWKTATKTIRYIARRHKVSLVWIPGAILLIALVGFLIKTFFTESPTTTLSKSIAVLPFSNIGESEQQYFADGFTEEIMNELSNFSEISVISRKSAFSFKGMKISDSSIASELGVRYLLKGELQLLPARIKIKVKLIDSESNADVWQERYDFAKGEIFKIKDGIIKKIASIFSIDPEKIRLPKYNPSPEVYESYLNGLYYRDKNTEGDNLLAITYFKEAIRKDSNYVPAIVSLANTQVENFRQGWDQSEKSLDEGKQYYNKALNIDSINTSAIAGLGVISDLNGKPDEAIIYLQKAYDKDKNNAVALTSLAFINLFKLGEPAKGLMYLKILQEVEPHDWLLMMNIGVGFAQLKNYPEALRYFKKSSQFNQEHEWGPYSLAYTYERLEQFDSAIYYYQNALQKNLSNPKTYEGLISVLLVTGKYTQAESIMIAGLRYLPNDHNILYGLGITYQFKNKKSEARKIFDEGLTVCKRNISKNPRVGENYACASLFNARLGNKTEALRDIHKAIQHDSTNEEVIMKVTRAYAIIGQKSEMLKWFLRAKSKNPEYDAAYLRTAMDFEKYRNDVDLLSTAR
jgi:serine/threonine protein kinase/Flp pilus assembly protein TadD